MKSPRVKWRRLMLASGKLNGAIKREADGASGVYAVRRISDGRVLYVGKSTRGTLWKTMLRHFHAPESFRKAREAGIFARPSKFATHDSRGYEVAVWVTSRGHRPRAEDAPEDHEATALEVKWIARLKPSLNVNDEKGRLAAVADDDLAGPWDAPASADDEDAWGGLLNPGPLKKRGAGQLRMFNPAGRGARVELGRLTRLTYRGADGRERALSWGLSRAPILAYDEAGRLLVVYGGRVVRAASRAETREYARTHWGEQGRGDVRAGGVALPPFEVLGEGIAIVYTTRKGGDGALVDYVHPWGEGTSRRNWRPPRVVRHACGAPKCAAEGMIALEGGTYRVTERGIVG